MKISSFAVIYMIIIIPIILVMSYYVSLQVNTINMQTEYTSKQLSATRDAIAAFELNTVEWNEDYSSVGSSRRRNVNASINTFTNSLANSLGISGASKQNMLAYIPAIAFTLYDGYYIYSPADTKQIVKNEKGLGISMTEDLANNKTSATISGYSYKAEDEGKILYIPSDGNSQGTYSYTKSDGTTVNQSFTLDPNNAKTDYSHILKPFISYSARYVRGDTDIVVNYTLDNYITIYGKVNGTYQIKSGYLIDTNAISLPSPETLTETIAYTYNGTNYIKNKCTYIYASDNTKVYFDGDIPFQVNATGERTNLEDTSAMYKKIVLDENGTTIYQALNNVAITSSKNVAYGKLYKDMSGTEYNGAISLDVEEDISARNYYYEAKKFSEWVYEELDDITIGNMQVNEKGLEQIYGDSVNIEELYGNLDAKIFDTNPESDASIFAEHKRNVIKQVLISNLNQAITSYSRNSEGNYQLPVLSETDWDQILRNVSMVTFVQGMPIGVKYYNNYVVATSTANNEYVNPNEIYLNGSDEYYHMPYCKKLTDTSLIGYRNTDYVIKSYTEGEETKYYYKHNINSSTTRQACYYCIVQRDLFKGYDEDSDEGKAHNRAYQTALARERYATHEFR